MGKVGQEKRKAKTSRRSVRKCMKIKGRSVGRPVWKTNTREASSSVRNMEMWEGFTEKVGHKRG